MILIFYGNNLLNGIIFINILKVVILVAGYSALTSVAKMRIPVECLVSIYFILFLFFVSSLVIFNAYAQQQGGPATGGNAIGSSIDGIP